MPTVFSSRLGCTFEVNATAFNQVMAIEEGWERKAEQYTDMAYNTHTDCTIRTEVEGPFPYLRIWELAKEAGALCQHDTMAGPLTRATRDWLESVLAPHKSLSFATPPHIDTLAHYLLTPQLTFF